MRRDIEKKVLKKVKPSTEEKEEVRGVAGELKEEIDELSDDPVRPKLVGSVAKDTFLKDPDIDMFVLFPTSFSKNKMSDIALSLGEELLDDTVEKYAEHPYLHGRYNGYKTDIVPCYEVSEIKDMKSSVDRTPLHTEYIIEKLPTRKKDDVRLLKAFLEGIGAYGAESKVQGFSGYLCELLILEFGGFEKLLKSASSWEQGKTIEIVKGDKDFDDPLIVIDPVDPERNVASALKTDRLSLFIYSSKVYLDEPEEEFFFPEPIEERSEEELSEILGSRGTRVYSISFPRPQIVEDNLYPQLQKAERNLCKHLEKYDFSLLHSDYFVTDDKLYILIELESNKIPSIEKHRGPPVDHPNTSFFAEKYGKKIYIEGRRLMVDRERDISDVEDAIDRIIMDIDLGSDLNPLLEDSVKIITGDESVDEHPDILNRFLDRTFPWER